MGGGGDQGEGEEGLEGRREVVVVRAHQRGRIGMREKEGERVV